MRFGSPRVALALAVVGAVLAGALVVGIQVRAARPEPPRPVLAAVVVTRVPASSEPVLPARPAVSVARTPVVAPQVNGGPIPFIPLDEAVRLAPFPIRLPSVIPPGMSVRGAIVSARAPGSSDTSGDGAPRVIVSFAPAAGPGGFALDQARGASTRDDGADLFPYVIPFTYEAVSVNGQVASYFRGAWHVAPAASPSVPGATTFDAAADVGLLHWRDGDMAFRLQQSGLRLTRDDLIRIAESVR